MVKSTLALPFNRYSNLSAVAYWNSYLRDAVNQGRALKALILFRHMKQSGIRPNNLTFPFVAKACGKLLNLHYSQMFHTHVVKSPFYCDMYVQTALVDMYVKSNHLDFAYNLFVEMEERDVTCWNAMLLGFAQLGLVDKFAFLFYEMRLDAIPADSVTVMGLTQLCSGMKDLRLLKGVHSLGTRIGLEADVSVVNTWVAAYAKCSDLGMAEMVFGCINVGLRTVVSWNAMLSGYAYNEESSKAVRAYKRMLWEGCGPDVSTVLSLLSSCVRSEALHHGKSIHCHGILVGSDLNVSVCNTLISMYSKCGDIGSARHMFDSILDKTCVSWNSIIGGYADKGDLDEALTLFHSMEVSGQKPDVVTMLYMISGCGQTGALDLGRWIDGYATSNRLKDKVMVCNALIDMYAKCGSIREASELFHTMKGRTIVSWTTMISACALHGKFKEALELFFQMKDLGLKPNHITFLAVLQACTHAGFLEKGWECFDLMTKENKINPGLDHCSCMVDLLGRRGKLKEALEFIHNMPIRPDAGVWGALLSSCKNYCNVEIGEYAAHRLFDMEPQAAAPYVEMANIYASAGRWDGVTAIRIMMKDNQVTKTPGESFVVLSGKTHSFTVENRSHPQGQMICEVLDALALQLKKEKDSLHLEDF